MRPKRLRELAFSWTGALLVLVVLAAVNGLARRLSLRLDFSEGRMYSVSEGTRSILGELEDTLLVKVFFTRNLPPPYGVHGRYLQDLLEEYRDAGRGRVRVEFVAPEKSDKARQEALDAGIPPVQLNVMSRDKFEVKEAFMGAALLYRGRAERLPVVDSVSELEYDLSRLIRRLVSPGRRSVGLVTGHGERTPVGAPPRSLFSLLREEMDLQLVDLSKGPPPPSVDALWVLGPIKPFRPGEVERLKAWAGSGRSLGLLLNRRVVDMGTFFSAPQETGLEGLLKSWGLELGEGVVADRQSERVQLETQYGLFTALRVEEYPFLPISNRLAEDHPATRSLQAVTLPFVHPLRFREPPGSGLTFTPLARSSPESWEHRGAQLSPGQPLEALQSGEKGPFVLAGVLEGDLFSVAPSTLPAAAGEPARRARGRVVVVGTSYQLHPSLADKGNNAAFLMNLLEWSFQDEALLSIRAKGSAYRPLRPLSDAPRALFKGLLVFFLPGALVAAGLLFYRREAARRRRLRALYAQAAEDASDREPARTP